MAVIIIKTRETPFKFLALHQLKITSTPQISLQRQQLHNLIHLIFFPAKLAEKSITQQIKVYSQPAPATYTHPCVLMIILFRHFQPSVYFVILCIVTLLVFIVAVVQPGRLRTLNCVTATLRPHQSHTCTLSETSATPELFFPINCCHR